MRRTFFLVTLLSGVAAAQTPAKLPFARPDIRKWTMDNGLEVVFLAVHKAPIVTVQVWYHVGSKDEARNLRGSAHMFEHMMFKGTAHVPPEQHARWIDGLGGDENAFTKEDMTAYFQTVPKQYLDFAVKLEAERMRNLLIRKEMVDTEREVVKEELRTRVESSPFVTAYKRFRAIAFTKHPYAWLPSGDKEDLDRLKVADLQRFYDAYYQPNNATLIIVGDVDEADVRTATQKYFHVYPKAAEPPRPAAAAQEPRQTQMRTESTSPAQIGLIIGGYHGPAAKSPDVYPLQVLGNILSGGASSRLYQRIVRKDQIGVDAGGQMSAFEDPGLFVVFAEYLKPEQGEKVTAALLDEIERVQREPVSAEELLKAKNQITAGYIFGLEGVDGLASQIGASRILLGDATAWVDDYAKYQAVTADDILRVAKTYLAKENLTLVTTPPAAGGGQ
jgi:zinc protease